MIFASVIVPPQINIRGKRTIYLNPEGYVHEPCIIIVKRAPSSVKVKYLTPPLAALAPNCQPQPSQTALSPLPIDDSKAEKD